ncbi:MAG TPA: VIT domain-containing protein [Pyrinomonadaceae bacterium]|nr:VIT domain-containing protein [Pyrinomonadaceae bacterium]
MVKKRVFLCFLFAIVSVLGSISSTAQTNADKTLSPYFHVQGDPRFDHLPLKETRVDVAISGVIADVRVLQTYRNEGSRAINAIYVFPASTRAAVYGMRMRIRDEIIVAKIKAREVAKQEFETAKKEGKSASLLEQDRPNVFTMSLANIMPQDQIEIELRYTELLIPTDGEYEFVYPTVVGPRYSSDQKDGGSADGSVRTAHLHEGQGPTSPFYLSTRVSAGLPIREITCPSHGIEPAWLSPEIAQITLDDTNPFQGNHDFILKYRLSGDQINSGLLLFQGEDENFFLYMAQPPARIKPEEIPTREYVFVVDVSGSMEGFPLNTSKQLLQDLIGNLRPNDYFNVVLFSGDSTALSERPLQANQENIIRAIDLIDQQRGSGGTELLEAIKRAGTLPHEGGLSRSIVLITDGYISAEKDVFDYIRENLGQTNVFSFGIGSSVNRYLIEGIAKAGMGEPFVVTSEAEAPATAAKFRDYIESPALTEVQVRAHGFDIYDVEPQKLPDLFARRPIILFGKWRGALTGTFELTGRTGLGDYASILDVSSFLPDDGNRAIRYLWARNRIAQLSDYGNGNLDEAAIQEITKLGIQYNLLTQYTSFIAVREKIVNPNSDARDVNQPLPLPLGVSDMAVGSEPDLVWMLLLAFGIGTVVLAWRRFTSIPLLDPAAK